MKSNRVLSGPAAVVRWRVLGLALALLAVLIALAVLATPRPEQAAAQTTTTFVSNTGKADSGTRRVDASVLAQAFGTGSHSAGYNLSSIVLDFGAAPTGTATLTVTVRADSSDDPSDTPLYTLTNPTLAAGANEFSAPSNATLDANKTYWVVASYNSATNDGPTWARTLVSSGVDTGAAAGWTINKDYETRARGATSESWAVGSIGRSLQIAVKGTNKSTTTTNVAPTAADKTVTTNEDTDHTFAASEFNFADTDTGDTLSSVKIVTLPATGKGTLELDGTEIASTALPQTVTKADIDGSKLKYSPPANANGTGYASFTFKVNDGTDDSATANTMTIDVTAVNDVATGKPTITGTLQVGQTLTAVTTGIMDVDGLPDSFTYSWNRVMAGATTLISGATSSTYTLVEADEGHVIRLGVIFTDNGGTREMTSVDSATVQPAAAATFISNTGQTFSGSHRVDTTHYAQPFGTGSHAAGYNLSSIGLDFSTAAGTGTLTVTVREDSSGNPSDTALYTLTNPTSSTGLNEFSAPDGATLDANETYWVVAGFSGLGQHAPHVRVTNTSNGVDAGTTPGWTMNVGYKSRASGASWTAASFNSIQIAVKGTNRSNAAPTVANEIADRTATVGTFFSASIPANTFADTDTGDTLTYTATKGDDTALPSWLGFNATTVVVSGTPAAGDVGTVTVKVTANDGRGGSVSDEFDIVVSAAAAEADRAGTVALSTTQPEMGIPMTATLTDADGSISGTTWQWSSSDTASGTFADISGATSATYRPAEADLTKFLKVTASYTDGHGPDKSATATATKAVRASRVHIVSTLSQTSGNARYEKPGIATQFTTGAHPGGYKLSDVRIRLRGTYTASSFQVHIYDSDSDGDPDESVYRLENPASISGVTSFDAPSGTRLAPSTTYFLAMVRTSGNIECETATADAYDSGRASDWTTGGAYALTSQGAYDDASNTLGCGIRLSGQAAIDTSYITGLEITSFREFPGAGYLTGEKLTATVTFSEALTVDTTTPPTLKVVIGSNTRTMTYNATESLSTTLEFDYFVQSADKDANGVSFNEDALTGTITRTTGSKPADLDHAALADDAEAIVNSPPPVTVSFGEATYSTSEDETVSVTVTLSAAPQRDLRIPFTTSFHGGATAADFDDPRTGVPIEDDEMEFTFNFHPVDDEVADHGESVRFSFGTLPLGVTAGDTPRTTITIIDNDPAVTVEFASDTYSAAEGKSATVTVTLSADPKRPLTIPITNAAQGTTTADDYTFTATDVTFASGQTSRTLTFTAAQDTTADHGDSVKLGFGSSLPPGVTEGTDDETTVTIIDDDPAVTVSFGAATYSADESGTVDVTLTLSADPQRPLTIPISAVGQSGATAADYEPPGNVTFASGDTSKTLTFTPENDTVDDDGEKVKLSFGTLPPGVTAGTTSSTVVSINDDDDPEVTVKFGAAAYSVNEKNNGTVTVTVTLNADPERTVSIPLSTSYGGTADSTAISGIPSSVSFSTGETSKTFVVTARDDFIDNDGRTATITFGTLPSRVTEGSTDETVVSVTDDDTRGFTITPTSATATVGENATTTYTITLKSEPSDTVTVTIVDPTDSDDATASPSTLSFTPAQYTDGALTVTVTTTDDEVDEPTETATVTHTVSGGDYGANDVTIPDFVVTITDDDETPVITGSAAPNFAEIEHDADPATVVLTVATYSATDGDGDDITWSLSGTDSSFFESEEDSGGDLVLSFDGAAFSGEGPDFEDPEDNGSNNTYQVTVEASDGTNSTTRAVTVTVTNVDETPLVAVHPAGDPAASSLEELAYDATREAGDLLVKGFTSTDEEEDTITWSLGGADAGDFEITVDTITSTPAIKRILVSFKEPPNFEDPDDAGGNNVYNIIVKASDGTNTGELAYTVTITDINERPDIDEDTVADYAEIEYDFTGTPGNVHTFTAEDYDDGDTFTWSLEGDDAGEFEIDSTTGVLTFAQDSSAGPRPNFETPRDDDSDNVYEVTVVATDDGSPALSSKHAVTVEVTNVNEKPEITGTPSLVTTSTYDENTTGNVADYNARDEEGSTIAWSLTGTDRGDFDVSTDGIVTFKNTPDFEDPEDSGTNNVFTFNVVASDSVKTNSVAVTVTVADVEEAGVITVSNPDPGVGDEIRFDLTDPDGGLTAAGITWFTESRSPGGAWSTAHGRFPAGGSSSTTFVLYRAPEQETGKELRVRAEYTDRRGSGKEATSPETQPVTADPIANAPPRFTGGNSFSIEEGEAGRNVGAPLATSDRDGDRVTFAMGTGEQSDFFAINATTGQLRLVKAVDFEDLPTLGFYLAEVTIHDGKGVDADNNVTTDTTVDATASVTVNIIDVEEVGVVTLSADEPETRTALDATLEDGDGSVSGESWTWARSANGRTNWFNIADETSSTYTPTEDDEDFYLRARVEYTDNRGSGKSAEGITDGRVPSLNRRPAFPDSEDGERSVDENTRSGANIGAPVAAVDPENNRLTYTLTGTDADAFTITGAGQIKVKDALDFETKESYSVTVNVHDGRDGSGNTDTTIDNSQDVTITVENVEEPGVVTLTTLTGVIQARVEVTAALSDDDGSVSGLTWVWSQSPNGRTDWANISGETGTTYTPTDAFESRYIRATASYTDGHGSSKTARGVSPRVAKAPPVNSPPAFPSTENGRREVAEDATGGAAVGAPVVATDLNAGDSAVNAALSYSLSGTDAASFEIDAASGQISLAQNVTLDYEGKRSYRVTVEVTDGHDELGDDEDPDMIDARQNVTITVTDVNEAPVVTGDGAVSVEENINRAIATYSAKDPERDTLTWSVSGADSDNFWVSDKGQLYFATPPSFEGIQTTYSVTVTATDDDATSPMSGSFDVTVTVTDVEEEGVVKLSPQRGWDGTSFTAELTDDDGVTGSTIWRWMRSSGRSGGTVIAGATSDSYTATDDDVNQYLRVTATYEDGRGSGKTAEAVLTARIGAVADRPATNTAPEFTEDDDDTDQIRTTTRSIGQGTAAGRSIGARVRATDPDAGDVLYYWLSGTDHRKFDIDSTTGQLRTKAVLDYDPDPQAENTYTVTINVSDGFDVGYNESTASDATIDVTITVTRVTRRRPPSPPTVTPPPTPVNSPPAFPSTEDGRREVAEDATGGATVGATVAATDVNAGDSAVNAALSYSLSGTDAASFEIDAASGQISLAQGVTLDYESKRSYHVTVEVTDGHDELGDDEDPDVIDARRNVTISVTDVNEAPVVTGEAATSVQENSDRAVATYTGTDPEGDTLTWSVSGADSDIFSVSDKGQLYFATPPSFEGQTSYSVTVTATDDDATPLSGSFDVTISVTRVTRRPPSPPTVTPPTTTPGGGATVAEPDPPGFAEGSSTSRLLPSSARPGDAVGSPVVATHPSNFGFTYSLSGNDSAMFTVDESTGQIRFGQAAAPEEGDRYAVTLSATASLGPRSSLTVRIEVSILVTGPEPPAIRYDLNRNGVIEKNEVLTAVSDYFAGVIEKEDVLGVVTLYFGQ